MPVRPLRKSKFYTCFYGDAVSEKDFYAKNLCVSYEGSTAVISLQLMQLLDVACFADEAENFDTFVFEDRHVVAALVGFLKDVPQLKFFKLQVNAKKYAIAKIKISKGGVRLFCM
jgi:hypothetical protein